MRWLIWPDDRSLSSTDGEQARHAYSERMGGEYRVSPEAEPLIGHLSDKERARLTTVILDRRGSLYHAPLIDRTDIEYAKSSKGLTVPERAIRLLRFLAQESTSAGAMLSWPAQTAIAIGQTESISKDEAEFLLSYLEYQGWVGNPHRVLGQSTVLVDGYAKLDALVARPDSSQCFVAMWLDKQMDDAYKRGIEPAIMATGYRAKRIDRDPSVQKIDDAIIAEIRRSAFVIADMTHGDDGARGSVYYEAGFAFGLNRLVIYSCRRNLIDSLHFDIRQYYHVPWDTPEELREGLIAKIGALLENGPVLSTPNTSLATEQTL